MVRVRRTASRAAGFRRAAVAAAAVLLSATAAGAHPHVWITATIAPVVDEGGRLTAVHEKWTFDEVFTEGIGPELDVNKDGMLQDSEIQNSTRNGVLWFVPAGYFTRITVGGAAVATKPAEDLRVSIPGPGMILEFTLPLADPRPVAGVGGGATGAGIDVFDPDYYVDVQFADPPVDGGKVPASCQAAPRPKANLDPTAVMILRRLGLTTDPAILNDPAAGFAVRVAVECK
jgi:ABC-type uncharacterized transport system substrate-binding protein